jgi:DNA-binding NtrC family response regulator
MRVGGTETIRIDIRLLAATNSDLESAVEQGRFRSDLYYRLKVVTLRIPPLRERRDDIPRLANHFLTQFTRENDRERMRLSADAMRALVEARWEGNVRELRNLIESLVVLTPHDEISAEDLPGEYRRPQAAPAPVRPGEGKTARGAGSGAEARTMEEIERDAILTTLERTGGNRTQAAELLGIGLRTLQRKLKDYVSRGLLPEEGTEP